MRKIFTSILAIAAFAMNVMATDYKDVMTVTIDGQPTTPTETTISVVPGDADSYTISLKNFILYMQGYPMPVGNIILENVSGTTKDNVTTLSTNQEIAITAGDDPNYEWIGPGLSVGGNLIPVDMVGEIRDNKFYTVLNISFMGMTINVVFGDGGYQIPNSDFEAFHKATYNKNESDEPNSWHSFMSASGSLTMAVSSNTHTFISTDVRPESTGKSCVKIVSGLVFGAVPANGTITTGRLQASGFSPEDKKNCSYLDMSKNDVDANGDPFYTTISGQPDAIKAWVKFKQGAIKPEQADNKYATISAAITDGTYYQDPEDKTYTNVVAKAKNDKIESKDFAWQEITIPFDYATYATNNVQAKAILVTISTNAKPGVASTDASNPDELYIDDLSLVYNSQLESVKIKGVAVDGFNKNNKEYNITGEGTINAADIETIADGKGAYVTKNVEKSDDGTKVTITVTSNDLKTTNVYVFNISGTVTGIDKVETTVGNSNAAIYNINGQRVSDMGQKGLYIIRQADGKTVKVFKK